MQSFLDILYPEHLPHSLPTHVFFDKACHLLEHLIKQGHTRLTKRTRYILDVFHGAKCHAESDEFCNVHCNPALCKEIFDEIGRCVFNSSACEEFNGWYGAFQSIVREMSFRSCANHIN